MIPGIRCLTSMLNPLYTTTYGMQVKGRGDVNMKWYQCQLH